MRRVCRELYTARVTPPADIDSRCRRISRGNRQGKSRGNSWTHLGITPLHCAKESLSCRMSLAESLALTTKSLTPLTAPPAVSAPAPTGDPKADAGGGAKPSGRSAATAHKAASTDMAVPATTGTTTAAVGRGDGALPGGGSSRADGGVSRWVSSWSRGNRAGHISPLSCILSGSRVSLVTSGIASEALLAGCWTGSTGGA
mmetsp:Transcript_22794/g.53185  ORF Transcript_22794/g.53185 Transcript_22794/m.53185 type:complete len:201 (-) Transcript_22794:630-1232(-)